MTVEHEDSGVKTTIEQITLKGSSSPDELQVVGYVHIDSHEYRVFAPGPAKGKSIDWSEQFIVRTSFGVNVPPAERILVIKYMEEAFKKLPMEAHIDDRNAATSSTTKLTTKMPKTFKSAFETYTIVAQAGRGGSGTVYRVTDSEHEQFALKVLTSNAQGKRLKRFRNEINFCSQDRSKNIVRIVEYGKTEEGFLFYVMPFYPSTLRDRIKQGIPPDEVLSLYSQILDGVEAAHLLGVYHRDIKPENILCDPASTTLVVADFGISRFKEEALLTSVNTGPHEKLANFVYAAPEQRVIGKTVDQRSDIYALGLLLNEMYTGEVPQGTGIKHIGDVAPAFSYLDELVESMIRQQPAERPSSIRGVKEILLARKNEFVRLQELDSLKQKAVPESEISDPLISDPIRAIQAEDYAGGVLALRLNRAINPRWEKCFRAVATGYSANVSARQISFQGDKAYLRVDQHFMQQLINYFKQYCDPANKEYARQITQEHQDAVTAKRASLRTEIALREAKNRILKQIKL
jgi:serine/threonine protein kinase